MTRNLVRLAILGWFAIAMYSGLREWTHHDVPVVVRVPVTETNPTGRETVPADVTCPAVIGGDGQPTIEDADRLDVVGPSEQPCRPFVRGRRLLFWIDAVVGVGALALTFAHLPRRRRDRRASAQTVTGRPVTA